MSWIIKAENISKKYIISHQKKERYQTIQEETIKIAKKGVKKLLSPFISRYKNNTSRKEDFWALKDINFEIGQGDRVGIIGRNGAGKSTLLKILSRITEPTTGKFTAKGRIASLLEVGTGFHPELTGRENIFLNGSILGMSKAEIKKKFDEIVAFAEVEKFLDTPVKRYSSGMYVRLAFAVAAHLEPEILIVDEVLAVGDAQFQKKCLGKMEEVSKGEGRTVLFVSHNMNAIEQLCNSCMMLDKGKIISSGYNVRNIIKDYLFSSDFVNSSKWINPGNEYINDYFKPSFLGIVDENDNVIEMPVSNNNNMWIKVEGEVKDKDPGLQIGYAIYSEEGALLYWTCNTDVAEKSWVYLDKGKWKVKSKIPVRLFNEGQYKIDLLVALYCKQWICNPGIYAPSIMLNIQGGLSDSPYWMVKRPGTLAPVIDWFSEKRG